MIKTRRKIVFLSFLNKLCLYFITVLFINYNDHKDYVLYRVWKSMKTSEVLNTKGFLEKN